MSEKLIKPYEISVWEDKLIQSGDGYDLIENKLAIIGSNTMTGPNKIYDPVFNKKSNGEKTLTFSLKYKYFDSYNENEGVINPFASLLVNERKVKLHYDDEWYEFIVKEHSESSEDYTWTYTCVDAFVYELSKVGYNIEFDTELNNNQGTAKELAEKTLKDTDWIVGDSDIFRQLIEEPIYKAILTSTSDIQIINTSNNEETTFEPGTEIYLFYSYVANKKGKFIQFIIRDETKQYVIDDKNVITDTNYRILTELFYKDDGFYKDAGDPAPVITWSDIETYYQANRLAYNQQTTYDPITKRTVNCFKVGDGREVYSYTDSIYTTSSVVMNFIANSDNFNILEDGTLRGWNPYVDSENNEKIQKLELATYPELSEGKALADIEKLFQIEGFLKVQFVGALTDNCLNAIYNDGLRNNVSFIDSISEGDEFVLRWRAGKGELENLQPTNTLGLLIAKYTRDTPQWGRYYYHINPDDIVLDIRPNSTPTELNNIIEGGEIEEIEGHQRYVIDGVIQTISTNYLYKNTSDGLLYYWDKKESRFEDKDSVDSNYLPYYYSTGQARKSITNSVLKDSTQTYGFFIYTVDNAPDPDSDLDPIYIQDIQLTRCIRDADNKPITIGNIPTATSTLQEYYYLKPDEGMTEEDIERYTDLEKLQAAIDTTDEILPVYNEDSEKYLSISASKSNCFDILQTIAETFECWIDLVVNHDDRGYITSTDGVLDKRVYLREYIGKDNAAGFKYGINVNSIERTVDSNEIVTKLIVDQSQSDYVDEGYVSIANAPSNQSGESYILNFEYYYNQGLLDRETVEKDRTEFAAALKEINLKLQEKEQERRNLEAALTKLGSNRNVYTELVDSAKDQQSQALDEFLFLTGVTYEEYKASYNEDIESEEPEAEPSIKEENIIDVLGTLYTSSATINNYSGILGNTEIEYWNTWRKLHGSTNYTVKIWSAEDDLDQTHVYVELNDYLVGVQLFVGKEETSSRQTTVSRKYFDITLGSSIDYDAVGELVVGTSTIAYGDGEFAKITLKTPQDFYFKKAEDNLGSTYVYTVGNVITLSIVTDENFAGVEDEIKELLEEKETLVKSFNNRYNRFISEGTWNSTEYIDPELYYLDALQVSNTSAQPTVSYTINVVEISQLDGFENYSFNAGDKTYIEDTEFFGWSNVNVGTKEEPIYVLTPAREEVIVSEVEWHLDRPEENVITVQNYKTRFEDLFQRISATVQTVQYNEATYAKMSTLMDANGTINENVLVDSLQRIAGKKYNLTTDGSVIIDGDRILVQNLTETNKRVIINSEGVRISSDGGANWTTAIDGHGINIGTVYTGKLNTEQVIIGSDTNPSFRWDKSGISAYRFANTNESEGYDLKTFVRYDQYGLYGIKNNETFKAQSLEDIKEDAHFAVTWDGFFIKNSYKGGGRVSLTSENDFQITNKINGIEQEKIKIGALEWIDDNNQVVTTPLLDRAPSKYGIRIKNNANQTVMETDDNGNLSITGTIYANAGEIGGMVVDDDKLLMDTIVIEPGVGIYSTELVNNQPAFIISDVDGSAIFNNVTARGHIEATSGTLNNLSITGGIVVAQNGYIQSNNWNNTTGSEAGWQITDTGATFNTVTVRGTVYANAGEIGGVIIDSDKLRMDHIILEPGVGIYSDYGVQSGQTNYPFIISDTSGKATFRDIEALGGLLSNLLVKDTITVGDNSNSGLIKSQNYTTGVSGWAIKSDGSAEFQNATVRGHIDATSGTLSDLDITGGITVAQNGYIRSTNYNASNQTGWEITDTGATFNDVIARGHIEASTGTLGDLDVIDTITVGNVNHGGMIQSYGYTAGSSGWAIKSNGTAEFQNAIVRGEVNAGSGNFYGMVTVGKENAQDPDYVIIDGQNALIRSANYSDGAGTGWLINNEGDAYFNNITARGAIKTAVFEYAEIQAVGGIFIFRPSSTIKGARINGEDLILKVEKPLLFAKISYTEITDPDPNTNPQNNGWYEKTNYGYKLTEDTVVQDKQYYGRNDINNGSWCKISNYLSDGAPADSTIQNILLTNGLTHVYQISNVNTSTSEVTLEGAKAFVNAVKQVGETDSDVLKQLEGGALVDMGRKDGSSNYGIGVNSSDNTVNLPARAISLFETEIDETKNVKVTYNYRGILGTLPTLSATEVSDAIYNQRMAGTQGIYTDNMYIGDKNQYIAFYEDSNGDKQLRIKANQIVYEIVDEETGESNWQDITDIEAEGVPGPQGPAGQDAIRVEIDPIGGNFIKRGQVGTSLIAHVYEGINDITNQFSHFTWYRRKADGTRDTSWSTQETSNQLSITTADVDESAVFVCEVTVTR